MKRLLREPLFHFLILGATIFAAYSFLSARIADPPGHIVVTEGKIENLAATFERTWQRPPTPSELEGLIGDYIREEVAVREALSLGLDEDDVVIRRRLRQKLEFVSEDAAARAEPTDEELRAWLNAHPDPFRIEPRFTFSQVYLNPEQRGQNLVRDARQLLEQLNNGGQNADVATTGDPFLLERRFESIPESEVKKQFGEKFTATLNALPVGRWQGPIESGYGAHLVFVGERMEGRLPTLEEVRDAVRRDWANAKRLEANEKFYQELLKRYTVTVEKSEEETDGKPMAERRP